MNKVRNDPALYRARFSDILSTSMLSNQRCVVVGVGAVGHQVARQLASMGVSLTLIDPDTITDLNVGPQLFPPSFVGTPKVSVVADECEELGLSIDRITISQNEYGNLPVGAPLKGAAVFSCVDNMAVRRDLAEDCVDDGASFFFEARMGAEQYEIHSMIPTEPALERWLLSWFSDDEADKVPCSAKATPYCACMCAAEMVAAYAAALRGVIHPRIVRNIFAAEFTSEPAELSIG